MSLHFLSSLEGSFRSLHNFEGVYNCLSLSCCYARIFTLPFEESIISCTPQVTQKIATISSAFVLPILLTSSCTMLNMSWSTTVLISTTNLIVFHILWADLHSTNAWTVVSKLVLQISLLLERYFFLLSLWIFYFFW